MPDEYSNGVMTICIRSIRIWNSNSRQIPMNFSFLSFNFKGDIFLFTVKKWILLWITPFKVNLCRTKCL